MPKKRIKQKTAKCKTTDKAEVKLHDKGKKIIGKCKTTDEAEVQMDDKVKKIIEKNMMKLKDMHKEYEVHKKM